MTTAKEGKRVAAQDTADSKTESSFQTFEGKVISVIDNKLMVRNKEGKEHSHILAKDTKLTCDGAVCTAEDLKSGSRIRVTTKKDDRNVATCVESLDKDAEFAPS